MKEWIKNIAWTVWVIIGLAILLIIACIVAWYRGIHEIPTSKTEYVKTPEVKDTVKIPRADIPVKKIVALDKKVAEKKLNLPNEIKSDPDKQITASGSIAPYEGKTDVLAVIDTETGVSSIVAKQVPMPFVDFEDKKEIGVRYGVSFKHDQEVDLYGRWSFFRVAGAHLGIYGEVNTTGDAKAMLDASYRW